MSNDSTRWLGRAIAAQRSEIERRWLDHVRRELGRRSGVALTQLRDGIPDYLEALAAVLDDETHPIDIRAGRAWAEIAREHGVTRVRNGFDISQLVREFIVLRHVIREVVVEQGPAPEGTEAALADLLDAAITSSVQSYVDARDYEARRRQAENIGFLTHELRTPVATALLAVEQLRRQSPNADPRALDRLERSLENLDQLVGSVLLTGKLEAGKAAAQPVPIRLEQVVEGAVEGARQVAEEKGLAFHLSYDPDLVARVDPALTRSALQNLADNAAKYTDGGEIDIAISAHEGTLEIDVRDTCNGLSPEELNTIFDPFQRGRTVQAGTGLGLAIARRAVEAQGGSIAAESSGTSGCHFQIRLPGVVVPDQSA
jgi:signal transduction histidine kinase